MVDIFKKLVFFSLQNTSMLNQRVNCNIGNMCQCACGNYGTLKRFDLQALYRFEAKFFQYSMLRNNIRFIKNYQTNKEYMIFKFGHSKKVCSKKNNRNSNSVALFAICEENDRWPRAQPWHCKHVVKLDQLLNFFSAMCLHSHHRPTNNNTNSTNSNDNKQRSEKRMWSDRFDHVLSPMYSNVSDNVVHKRYNNKYDYKTNLKQVMRMLHHGFKEHDMQEKYGNKHTSETKYDYLNKICRIMKIDRQKLFNILGLSIENAFKFAQRYPETVLTQVYIDETNCSIGYEMVLLAEIEDVKRKKVYKFGVPVEEIENFKTNRRCYIARNILTPLMAVKNIQLNLINDDKFDYVNSWVRIIENDNVSFYKQMDSSWNN